MILDHLLNANFYLNMHPLFDEALRFLQDPNLSSLALGRHEIKGDQMFALVQERAGKSKEEARMEAHRRYIDIQYIADGVDLMGWRPLSKCNEVTQEYSVDRDIVFYGDKPETWFEVQAGSFAIFYPQDVHAPLAAPQNMRKVVIKIAVEG